MTFAEEAQRDAINMLADSETTAYTWNGASYSGTIGATRKTEQMSAGGFTEIPIVRLTSPLKTLSGTTLSNRFPSGTPPAVGQFVTIGSATYIVDSSEVCEFSAVVSLELVTVNR